MQTKLDFDIQEIFPDTESEIIGCESCHIWADWLYKINGIKRLLCVRCLMKLKGLVG